MKLTTETIRKLIKEELNEMKMAGQHAGNEMLAQEVPKGFSRIPEEFQPKLKQLAASRSAGGLEQALELASILEQDDKKLKEISDYLYDAAIDRIAKEKNMIIRKSSHSGGRYIEVFQYMEDEDDWYFMYSMPSTTPREEIYKDIMMWGQKE